MKVEIKEKFNRQLVQCIYLGNLVINEFKKSDEEKREYIEFIEDVFRQIIDSSPKRENICKFVNMPNEKSEDVRLSDFYDGVEDSVKEYYEEYRRLLFCEMLADKIADRNYPVIGFSEADAFENLLAKKLYFELLKDENCGFVHIDAPKICGKLKRAVKI